MRVGPQFLQKRSKRRGGVAPVIGRSGIEQWDRSPPAPTLVSPGDFFEFTSDF
jgi:hypothetical protein